MDPSEAAAPPLERSVSQQSNTSYRSHRSRAGKNRALFNHHHISSSASSIAESDKSLTSFPSFSPELPGTDRFGDADPDHNQLRAAIRQPDRAARAAGLSGSSSAIVDSLTWRNSAREALFEDAPLSRTVPGALHRADDGHIERLVARHGAVALVRQIAGDLAQRDAQISALRRRADERERALRKMIRECGLSSLELETRLRAVESELRSNGHFQRDGGGLSDLMSDAMRDTVTESSAYGEADTTASATIRAGSGSGSGGRPSVPGISEAARGTATLRGWKDYLWGGTSKRAGPRDRPTVIRSHSGANQRPALQDDLFDPPAPAAGGPVKSPSSRPSSIHSATTTPERKGSASLASLALRLVAGGAVANREAAADARGRAASNAARTEASRTRSVASNRTSRSSRPVSVAGGPKALMAMGRSTPSNAKSLAEVRGSGSGGSPGASTLRPDSFGPVEMDAILPPESQPPTLTRMYNNYPNSEYLTDRFGFIYDQRRKKRQREASEVARHVGGGGDGREMLGNGRAGIPPLAPDDVPSPKMSVSSGEPRPGSPSSQEQEDKAPTGEDKAKRWQDYLKIATFPTELLSHTPGISATAVSVTEGTDDRDHDLDRDRDHDRASSASSQRPVLDRPPARSPAITPTVSGLVPLASTTTTAVVDSEATLTQPLPLPSAEQQDGTLGTLVKEDAEPVKLLLQQLSDLHDSLQREKTTRWNEFLRKVRAERHREGEAAMAAAAAAAEARFERPGIILPEARVADGEVIGISNLGNKGKVGRAKWNGFKALVLGGIPVLYRAKVWSECSGAAALRIPGYYDGLASRGGGDDDPAVVSQIKMDIHRTLTDNIFFRRGPGVQKLNEVLLAYSRRNRDVGYCQGMNLIAANILLVTPSAEEAFWILASIVENILPHGYYDHSLISSRADQQVLRQYVRTVLPRLSAHLDSLAVELEALTFQWFLSVFTDCLCAEALFRVWDVVLCTNDGSTFLFQVALALLKLNESNLLQCDTPAGVYTYINHQMTEHAISIDGLIQASEGLRRVVRREDVEQRRAKAIQAERDMVGGGEGGDGGGSAMAGGANATFAAAAAAAADTAATGTAATGTAATGAETNTEAAGTGTGTGTGDGDGDGGEESS
ncbi:tbc domain-containing [Trichoderma cornu-damae]|uniref:Tbc domain-containing n=1 Tax=Trichoderma cornu-damae TaxID=654480 RepID=A0A9P8QKZ5_9HYPO|nr:tbc domain-containing [Trichoderma cornu-damae]